MDDPDRKMSRHFSHQGARMTGRSATPAAVLVFAWLALFSAGFARAEWNIATEFRIVRVPVVAGVEIVEQFSEERTTPDAVAALDSLLRKGEATLVKELFGKGVSGAQQAIEDVEEFRYHTEYGAPHPLLAPEAKSGFTRRLKSVEQQGERVYDYQPKVAQQKTTENRALPLGKWVLQAFHKRPAPFNDIEITIVRIKTNHVQFTHQKP